MTRALVNLVKCLFGVILSVIWLPLGGVFWFPLVVRALAAFSFSVVRASVVGGVASGQPLEQAICVWGNGFKHIWRGLFAADPVRAPETHSRLVHMAGECLWAGVVWYSTIWVVARWTPGLAEFHEWWSTPVRPIYQLINGA